jgi:hypothetical protein
LSPRSDSGPAAEGGKKLGAEWCPWRLGTAYGRQRAAAAEALRQALGLWRGPTLSGINSRTLTARATQLDEARLTALESCLDLELGLGRHRQVVAEIVTLVAEDRCENGSAAC